MGNCASGNAPMNEEERAKNREIEKELQQQKKVIEQELKVRKGREKERESLIQQKSFVFCFLCVVLKFCFEERNERISLDFITWRW